MENLFRTVDITYFKDESSKILFSLESLNFYLGNYKKENESINVGFTIKNDVKYHKYHIWDIITELDESIEKSIKFKSYEIEIPEGLQFKIEDCGEESVLNYSIFIQTKNIKYRFSLKYLPQIIKQLKKIK